MKIGKIIAHIPARGGSKRLPSKNLRYLNGKPMIAYAIENALACAELADVYVNTDSPVIGACAEQMGCKVYLRNQKLGDDSASGEDFTFDFLEAFRPDTLMMINPVCPLIDVEDIGAALRAYAGSEADTLISCSETHLQSFCMDRAVNVEIDGPLAPSQQNPAVIICNWAVTIWNAAIFRGLYKHNRSGYFGVHRLFWPLDPLKAVKISEEKDFRLAESLLISRQLQNNDQPRYWNNVIGQPEVS